jgi:hypothetical protein
VGTAKRIGSGTAKRIALGSAKRIAAAVVVLALTLAAATAGAAVEMARRVAWCAARTLRRRADATENGNVSPRPVVT